MQLRKQKSDDIGGFGRGKIVIGDYVVLESAPFDTKRSFNEFLFSKIIDIVSDVLRYYATSTSKSDMTLFRLYSNQHGKRLIFAHFVSKCAVRLGYISLFIDK